MTRIARAARIVLAMLQEIFDEAAYERFLSRAQMASSPKAYSAFRQELDESKSRRPRCC